MKKFLVRSPAQGLNTIRHPDITANYKRALRWKPRHKKAVLVPCAGTKPFPDAPSHRDGYLKALEGKDVDLWVVAEPLGVVPYAWSRDYPNADYDFPPAQLRGEGRELLVQRVADWFEKVGPKYQKVTLALPGHHARLVEDALAEFDGGSPARISWAGIGDCLDAGACPTGHYRSTSKAYRKFLKRRANPADPRQRSAERDFKQRPSPETAMAYFHEIVRRGGDWSAMAYPDLFWALLDVPGAPELMVQAARNSETSLVWETYDAHETYRLLQAFRLGYRGRVEVKFFGGGWADFEAYFHVAGARPRQSEDQSRGEAAIWIPGSDDYRLVSISPSPQSKRRAGTLLKTRGAGSGVLYPTRIEWVRIMDQHLDRNGRVRWKNPSDEDMRRAERRAHQGEYDAMAKLSRWQERAEIPPSPLQLRMEKRAQWDDRPLYLSPLGEWGVVPHSELAMHMRIAGRQVSRYAVWGSHPLWHLRTDKVRATSAAVEVIVDGVPEVFQGGTPGELLPAEVRRQLGGFGNEVVPPRQNPPTDERLRRLARDGASPALTTALARAGREAPKVSEQDLVAASRSLDRRARGDRLFRGTQSTGSRGVRDCRICGHETTWSAKWPRTKASVKDEAEHVQAEIQDAETWLLAHSGHDLVDYLRLRVAENPPTDERLRRLVRSAVGSGDPHLILRAAKEAARARRPDLIYNEGGLLEAIMIVEQAGGQHTMRPGPFEAEVANLYWHAKGAFEGDPMENPSGDERRRRAGRGPSDAANLPHLVAEAIRTGVWSYAVPALIDAGWERAVDLIAPMPLGSPRDALVLALGEELTRRGWGPDLPLNYQAYRELGDRGVSYKQPGVEIGSVYGVRSLSRESKPVKVPGDYGRARSWTFKADYGFTTHYPPPLEEPANWGAQFRFQVEAAGSPHLANVRARTIQDGMSKTLRKVAPKAWFLARWHSSEATSIPGGKGGAGINAGIDFHGLENGFYHYGRSLISEPRREEELSQEGAYKASMNQARFGPRYLGWLFPAPEPGTDPKIAHAMINDPARLQAIGALFYGDLYLGGLLLPPEQLHYDPATLMRPK